MLNQTQEIIEFAQDRINMLYDKYQGAAPGEYDEQVINGVIAITKYLLDTAVKIEALEKLAQLDFTADHMGTKDTDAIRDIYKTILNYNS